MKEVEKPKVSKPKESTVTETPKPDPVNVEQEDFIDLLDKKIDDSSELTKDYLENLAENLVNKLEEFGIEGRVEDLYLDQLSLGLKLVLHQAQKPVKYLILLMI